MSTLDVVHHSTILHLVAIFNFLGAEKFFSKSWGSHTALSRFFFAKNMIATEVGKVDLSDRCHLYEWRV